MIRTLVLFCFLAFVKVIAAERKPLSLERDKFTVKELPWAANEIPIESYAGLIPVRNETHLGSTNSSGTGGEIFYWFFPALEPLVENPPLIIWLQGGPGSSSFIGIFYEMGPIIINVDGTLSRNPSTWNTHSSMLFIDNPLGTGYSFVGNKADKKTSEQPFKIQELKKPLLTKYQGDCKRPEIETKPRWENGYVANQAAVAHDIIVFLDRFYYIFPEQLKSKLYVTGESYAGKYVPALGYFIDKVNEGRKNSTTAKHPQIPLVGMAIGNGLTDPISQVLTHSSQALALGLVGEKAAIEMDLYALTAVNYICENNYKLALQARESLFSVFNAASGNINNYDVRRGNREYNRSKMYALLRDPKTKIALNVGIDAVYGKDWNLFPHLEEDIMKSSVGYIEYLLNKDYHILLYQGQFDFRDGILSQNSWIKSMEWKYQRQYLEAPRKPWYTESGLSGYSTWLENLVRVEVLNCGHLCPGDVNSTTAMIEKFLIY
jgi:vitellogenic carboxypeptidase-like protein